VHEDPTNEQKKYAQSRYRYQYRPEFTSTNLKTEQTHKDKEQQHRKGKKDKGHDSIC
jgi:hypothetical protein